MTLCPSGAATTMTQNSHPLTQSLQAVNRHPAPHLAHRNSLWCCGSTIVAVYPKDTQPAVPFTDTLPCQEVRDFLLVLSSMTGAPTCSLLAWRDGTSLLSKPHLHCTSNERPLAFKQLPINPNLCEVLVTAGSLQDCPQLRMPSL